MDPDMAVFDCQAPRSLSTKESPHRRRHPARQGVGRVDLSSQMNKSAIVPHMSMGNDDSVDRAPIGTLLHRWMTEQHFLVSFYIGPHIQQQGATVVCDHSDA